MFNYKTRETVAKGNKYVKEEREREESNNFNVL